MNLTPEEKQFLLQLMTQVSISPAQDNATMVVALVQSIIPKLKEAPNV